MEGPDQDPDDVHRDIYRTIQESVAVFFRCLFGVKMAASIMVQIFIGLELLCRSIMNQLLRYLAIEVPGFNNDTADLIILFFSNVFESFKVHQTAYKNKQAIRRSPLFVAPRTFLLGRRWEKTYDQRNGHYRLDFKECEFQYVPIVDTLKSLFMDPRFRNVYFNQYHNCEDGVYERFCCGNVFKDSLFFERYPDAILIQLYYDDFTLSCQSKSQPTVQLGGVYFTVQNLPKELNSHIDNIHLCALFHVQDLKNIGQSYNKILAEIVREIASLQTIGIDVGEY